MKFREFLKNNIVVTDGALGTMLQAKGLPLGVLPEKWNISNPDILVDIHKAYYDVGCNLVSTNTFGANLFKFDVNELETIIKSAISCVKAAKDSSSNKGEKFIAFSIGSLGKMLKPFGDLEFEKAYEVFKTSIGFAAKYGADVILIETMTDAYETKAAVLAAKDICNLPIIVSNAYNKDGRLLGGTSPRAMVALLEGLGVDAIGVNCSLGPQSLFKVIDELLEYSSLPIHFAPNAGLPKIVDGKTTYDITPDEFASYVASKVKDGVRICGGCCGTTPLYIEKLIANIKGVQPKKIEKKNFTMVSSYMDAVVFDKEPVLIGERINPTGKKRFKQALIENDIDYILQEGIKEQDAGAHILDVNVGLPDIDENAVLQKVVFELQAVSSLPLQIDTASPVAMENALRLYNGKALINSVNGKEESMKAIFPLVKKYGGTVIALTLDEKGIPETIEGRVAIAKKILKTAEKYGIEKKDIIFDTLTMTIATDKNAALVTIGALKEIKEKLGCHTSLGVSNVSFGLPNRDEINSCFFLSCLENGLSAAIMNPFSYQMMKTYFSYRALHGMDESCKDYIDFISTHTDEPKKEVATSVQIDGKTDLQNAIVKGLKDKAAILTETLLKEVLNPLDIVQNEVIPALDIVGVGYENKTMYLPQLLMSAEAAKAAFEVIKVKASVKAEEKKCKFVLATVKGDIHDIGKNIVKLLMENYGFDVYDLGKDVDPEIVVNKIIEEHAPLCGLSALMTTTVPSMEATIKLIREKAPWCKVVVGGAVLTKECAEKIGADAYSKDAMETVRYAEKINELI